MMMFCFAHHHQKSHIIITPRYAEKEKLRACCRLRPAKGPGIFRRVEGGPLARAGGSPPRPLEGPGAAIRGRGPSWPGMVVGAGCRGWMLGMGVGAPVKCYGGFPPSLAEKNVANATPLHPTAQGSALPPSPALLPHHPPRGLGGVAFRPTHGPHAKNVANASPFAGAGCPGLRFSPSPPHPPGGGCPPPVGPRARPTPLFGRLPAGCRGGAVAGWMSGFWIYPTQHNEAYYCWETQ